MTSEIQAILKGMVVKTTEFESNKKIIGISQTNITDTQAGPAPLSKQNGFAPAEVESQETLASAAEKVLGFNPNQAVPIQDPNSKEPVGFKLPEPEKVTGVTDLPPVFVNDAQELNKLVDQNALTESTANFSQKVIEPLMESISTANNNTVPAEIDQTITPETLPPTINGPVVGTEPTGDMSSLFAPLQEAPKEVVEPVVTPAVAPIDIAPIEPVVPETPVEPETPVAPPALPNPEDDVVLVNPLTESPSDGITPLPVELPQEGIPSEEESKEVANVQEVTMNNDEINKLIDTKKEEVQAKVNQLFEELKKEINKEMQNGKQNLPLGEISAIDRAVEEGMGKVDAVVAPTLPVEEQPPLSM